jgi:hypothetical protein
MAKATAAADAFLRAWRTRLPAPPWMRPLLDVDMDQRPGIGVLVANRRLKPETPETPHPFAFQDSRDGRQRHRQQFGNLRALNRNRRNWQISSTRSGLVLCGIRFGADDRSRRPASPSPR